MFAACADLHIITAFHRAWEMLLMKLIVLCWIVFAVLIIAPGIIAFYVSGKNI